MSRKSSPTFLDDEVELLVKHFGVDRVRNALSKISNGVADAHERQARFQPPEVDSPAIKSITITLEELRQIDTEKYRILDDFYLHLKNKKVLPESQDIRHFAQLIGLKEINGKSRKDLIPKLIRFLVEQPVAQLRTELEKAANISEQQRENGFSVLTDSLLGDKEG